MSDPRQPPTLDEARAALRLVFVTAPESASVIERYIDAQDMRLSVMQSTDPFRALVLALSDAMSKSNGLVDDVRGSILRPLAEAELLKERRLTAEALASADRALTVKQALSQPVVLAGIAIVGTAVGGALQIVQHLLGI